LTAQIDLVGGQSIVSTITFVAQGRDTEQISIDANGEHKHADYPNVPPNDKDRTLIRKVTIQFNTKDKGKDIGSSIDVRIPFGEPYGWQSDHEHLIAHAESLAAAETFDPETISKEYQLTIDGQSTLYETTKGVRIWFLFNSDHDTIWRGNGTVRFYVAADKYTEWTFHTITLTNGQHYETDF